MRLLKRISLLFLVLEAYGCVTEFIPEIGTDPEYVVVEGLLTDQPGRHYIKLSKSVPLGAPAEYEPLGGCTVWINDDLNNKFNLLESSAGTYVTNDTFFGQTGRTYTLNIQVVHYEYPYNRRVVDHNIKSVPVTILPVPEIDSLYYEKVELKTDDGVAFPGEGCQILLNTSDPENRCKYYRWDYTETWKTQTPAYPLTLNRICWVTNNSEDINIKDVTDLYENKINRLTVKFISNESDRFLIKYRIAVNQYSLTEHAYNYWSDLEKIAENTGNLYDAIPSAIEGNMYCSDHPGELVLGYFSVSSKRSKYIYIDEFFKGQLWPYKDCLRDTLYRGPDPLPFYPLLYDIYTQRGYYLVEDRWAGGGFVIVTKDRGCIDCTVQGSINKPDYWED